MSKYQYKNETSSDIVLVGVGTIPAGGSIETDLLIDNPNVTRIRLAISDRKAPKKADLSKEDGDVE